MADPGPPSGLVRVSFEVEMTREELIRHGGGDFIGADQGITVESCAAAVVQNHDPRRGWVKWQVLSSDDAGPVKT